MNNAPNRWIASLFLAGMLAIIAFGGSRAARQAPQGSNVIVSNATTQPVPISVQGTPTVKAQPYGTYNVQVAGTPTVHAEQAGAYNVQLVGNPTVAATQSGSYYTHLVGVSPVSVGNTSANPVPVQEQTPSYFSAFQTFVQVAMAVGNPNASATAYTVPVGMRFVVESVSAYSTSSAGNQAVEAVIQIPGKAYVYIPLTPTGLSGDSFANLSGSPLLVADAGQAVSVATYRALANDGDGSVTTVQLAGHLVADPNSPQKLSSGKP